MRRPLFNLQRYLSPDQGEGGIIIDPDNTMFGEDGEPVEVKKEEETPVEKEEETKPAQEAKAETAPEAEQEEEKKPEAEKEEPKASLSVTERMLKANGYELDEIEIEGAEGPVKKKISELTAEEQLNLISGELETLQSRYDERINTLSGDGAFKTEMEKQIITFLRTNGDPKALADFIRDQDPAAKIQSMSNEDLVKDGLKKMGWSEEDITEEIEALQSAERLDKYAERLKKNLDTGAEPDFSKLASKQTEFFTKQMQEEHSRESKSVDEFLKSKVDIEGFPLNDEVRDYLKKSIVPESFDKDSAFLEKISTPEGLAKAAFLMEFFDDIKANYESQISRVREEALNEAKELTSKFRDEPVVNNGGGIRRIKATEGKTFNQSKKESEQEF